MYQIYIIFCEKAKLYAHKHWMEVVPHLTIVYLVIFGKYYKLFSPPETQKLFV